MKMVSENLSTDITSLVETAENKWIPRWFDLFSNPNGGFFERLDQSGEPIDLPRRLLSQCRQIIVYSLTSNKTYTQKLNEAFDFIKQHYFIPDTGGSIFSLNSKNEVHDHTYDLYAHAFILLTCSQYYKATQNEDALAYAKTTLNFIKSHFPLHIGYAESLDSDLKPRQTIRRQNPHMHLLEGCIFMYETSKDEAYKETADEIISLFLNNFFDQKTSTLGEFFDHDLKLHPQEGYKIEAAHHGEWIWLLSRYKNISDQYSHQINSSMTGLWNFIFTHGFDQKSGGVFNVQDTNGSIIEGNKRIWTSFEVLRAANVMRIHTENPKDCINIMTRLIDTITNHYVDVETGNWNETLAQDLTPITNYLPATTPYHIYPILNEIKESLNHQ